MPSLLISDSLDSAGPSLTGCDDYLSKELPCVPLIHFIEVLFFSMNDNVRSFMLMLEVLVSNDASEFENLIVDRIQTAHFEVNP